jgi:hypothetical protein
MVADFWDALRGPKRCSKTSRRAIEDAPAERHKPLAQLFDRVCQDNGTIVTRRAPHAVRALLRDRRRHPGPKKSRIEISSTSPEIAAAGEADPYQMSHRAIPSRGGAGRAPAQGGRCTR